MLLRIHNHKSTHAYSYKPIYKPKNVFFRQKSSFGNRLIFLNIFRPNSCDIFFIFFYSYIHPNTGDILNRCNIFFSNL